MESMYIIPTCHELQNITYQNMSFENQILACLQHMLWLRNLWHIISFLLNFNNTLKRNANKNKKQKTKMPQQGNDL